MCVSVCLKIISDHMAGKSSKSEAKKKIGVVRRARDIYGKAVCGCGGGTDRRSVVDCTLPRKYAPKEIDGEDLRGLMQLLSMGKGGGATVDVDSEGNIVWRKPEAAETSYGGGVGRIGRIDEEKPCCFKEVDVFNKYYSRTGSSNNNYAINIRNIAY